MNWPGRANLIRRFGVSRLAGWGRAETGRGGQGMLDDSLRTHLIDRGVTSITSYHEAGESDGAFAALRLEAAILAEEAARLGQGFEGIGDLILAPIRMRIELMYDEKTAERLMAAFECGYGPAGPLWLGRDGCD